MKRNPQFLRTMFVFGLLGPAIANVLMVILAGITAALAETSSASGDARFTIWLLLFSLLIAGLPFAYVYGLVPALVTGSIYSWLILRVDASRHLHKGWRAIAAGLIGTIVSACTVALIEAPSPLENVHVNFAAVGAVTAFSIGYFWPRPGVLSNNSMHPTCEDARADRDGDSATRK